MSRDSYRDFADVYDAWQMLYPRAFSLAIAPRVVAAMKEHVVPNTVLADLACGTGIFPLWWQKTHPAWTGGSQQLFDRGGRLSRFNTRFGNMAFAKKK